MCLQINRRIFTTIAAMLTLCATAMAQTDTIRYVKTSGSYTADGRSWANAKCNLQDAINDLYDYLQRNNLKSGRVLVAEGTYTPTETTASDADGVLNTSFKIYEGITVYGGFDKGETNDKIQPSDRVITDTDGKFQWVFAHKTILSGNHSLSSSGKPLTWNDSETKMQYDESFPGNSYHVVWFATNGFDSKGRANALAKTACVDGCEIREGYASNRTVTSRSHTSYGGGAYMTEGAILRKCILTQNAAKRRGGAVYMDGGGRMENCYVTRNQTTGVGLTDGQGGGVCMEDGAPVVMHCIIENNSARIGGGLAIWTDRDYSTASADSVKLFYQPAAMGCIVNNNTSSTEAGGVLMRGGTINHLTVTANQCTGQDITYENRRMGRSAGLYVDEGAQIVNSVFWGGKVDNRNVQYAAYTRNSIADKYEPYVRYSAFSAYEHTDWTGTTKQGVLSLSSENRKTTKVGYFPQFRQPTNDGGSNAIVGVVKETTADDYPLNQNWKPDGTSQLRARGVQVTDLNNNANIIQSHITQDYGGANYVAKTVLGAIVPYDEGIKHALVTSQEKGETATIPTLFVDPATGNGYTVEATELGSSWTQPLSTINDALGYFRSHQLADGTWTFDGITYNSVQILVKEGVTNCVGSYLYGSLRTSNLNMVSNVRLYGGYSSELDNADVPSKKRNPVKYITRITADISGNGYTYNSCHIINLSNVTGTVIDGFQIYYANAYDPSNDFSPANKNGAGVICGNTNTATGTEIDMINTLRNCVIANCKGEQGAALYVSSRTKPVTLNVENCIIHNNMAMASSNPAVITATESGTTLKLNHCTVRGNVGYGVLSANGAKVEFNNSALHANASAPKAAVADLTSSDILCFATDGGTYSGSNNIIDNGQSYPSGITESAATLTYTAPASGTLSTTYPKFVNPTRNVGINEEGDVTVYGGVTNFMPGNMNPMVNAATSASESGTDMAGNTRDYGGAADIGAVENTELPENGKVFYVRTTENGGNDSNDGKSWIRAFATVQKALSAAESAVNSLSSTDPNIEVWVAAGTYASAKQNSRDESVYIIRDRVDVYGAFPVNGNPGKKERQPLVSSSVKVITGYSPSDYETILTRTSKNTNTIERVLGQPYSSNPYNGSCVDYKGALWDGFTLTGGAIDSNSLTSNGRNGGAGAAIYKNVTLKNCVVTNNLLYNSSTDSGGSGGYGRAGGVYLDNGTIVNCYIINNKLMGYSTTGNTSYCVCYGGGVYMYSGTMYNTVIAKNEVKAKWAEGAGVFMEEGYFFNNTCIGNKATCDNINGRGSGGISIWCNADGGKSLYVFNTISIDNETSTKQKLGDKNISVTTNGVINCFNCISTLNPSKIYSSGYNKILFNNCVLFDESKRNELFSSATGTTFADYDLRPIGSSLAVNTGINEPEMNGTVIADLSAFTDMDYADRIQDCTVDIGAYEYNGAYSITPDTGTSVEAVYYVTQNGAGNASAANPKNSACWQKLQKVLDAAGRYKLSNPSKRVIVKLAKFDYMPRRSTETNATEENPRTYSIIVPKGVEVWGGYSDKDDFATRDVIRNKTTLSGLYQSEGLDVNVYHVVTFTEDTFDKNGGIATVGALASIKDKAVLDGLFIENGDAEGEPVVGQDFVESRYGGAAIVKKYAHVRNCIIRNNKAVDGGGGLCMEQGALVTGCVIDGNSALSGRGGAIYVRNTTVNSNAIEKNTIEIDTNIARVMAGTIVNNSAEKDGGGIYFGDAEVRVNSVVIWKNTSNGDHNVCGQTDPGATDASQERNIEGYPLSYCAVENLSVAGINNISVSAEDNQGVRFESTDHTDAAYYKPKEYSVLVRSGMEYGYWTTELTKAYPSLETKDFATVNRTGFDNGYIEIGARAIGKDVKVAPTDDMLMKRIYVASPTASEVDMTYAEVLQNLAPTEYYSQRGSSQSFPMLYLDDALEYVRSARKDKTISNIANTEFEILLRAGTYTPRRDIKGKRSEFSRGNTYLVPEGVSIIGGLGKDAGATGEFYGATDKKLPSDISGVTIKNTQTSDILTARETYDNNKNNIIEPWEFKYVSELSGSVTNGSSSFNVFHVISCIADKKYVGELPTDPSFTNATADGKTHIENGKTILLDGVKISNGNALNYDPTTAERKESYYRGGAICVDGNWTNDSEGNTQILSYKGIDRPRGYRNIPLEIRNCKFIDNKGGLGGAIYTNSELKIFTSTFVRNTAQEGKDSDGKSGTITFDGQGGAINASSNTTIVNSVFANNEATAAATSASKNPGYGGAISLGEYSSLHMLNCDVVRNKAVSYPAIYAFTPNKGYTASDASNEVTLKTKNPHKIVNTILWGNETSSTSGSRMVFNFIEDAETKHAEALWFCAYEDGTGLTPLSHPHEGEQDFRKQEYGKFGTYIPYLWKDVTSETKYMKDGLSAVTNNIFINSNNDLTDGPNFISPSTTAGAKGHNESADWMIGRINNLTDNGWTYLEQNDAKTAFVTQSGSEKYDGKGIYYSTRYDQNNPTLAIGNETYMKYADGTDNKMRRISLDPNPTHYQSYIDIGAYEYQHVQLKPSGEGEVDVLWVTEQENQSAKTADGRTWETATSDLQRAIETLLASRNNHRKEIRLLEGLYQPVYTINNNLGFNINTEMHNSAVTLPSDASSGYYGVASLTIQGGWSKSVKGQYSIKDYPAYLFSSERTGVSGDKLSHILMVDCAQQVRSYRNGENVLHDYTDEVVPITLEGLIFCNTKGKKHTVSDGKDVKDCNGGAAVFYKPQYKKTDGSTTTTDLIEKASNYYDSDPCKSNLYKKLTIRQCDIRINGDRTDTNPLPAVTIGAGGGDALIYNTLFHSNAGNPLEAVDTKVINCTFAKNGGHVVFNTNKQSTSELHNSLFWKNDIFVTGDHTKCDVKGLTSSENMTHNAMTSLSADDVTNNNYKLSETNGDVLKGPNFKNPADKINDKDGSSANLYAMALRDFNVLPSAMVIGKADPKLYINKVYYSSFDYSTGADDNQKIEKVKTFLKTINTKKDNTEKAAGITLGQDVTYRADASDVADKDLGYQNRMYGTAGMELGAYECIASLQQVLYYNPNRPNGGDGKAWATAYGKSELQTAIDAAAVYPQVMKVTDKNAYVIAKGGNNTGESIVMRDGVTLIGSVYNTYLKQHDDKSANQVDVYSTVEEYLKRVVYDRAGLAADGHDLTTVKGVTADGDAISNAARFDGLEISNEDATSPLTSPVINFTAATSSDKGVLMLANTIVHDNNMADGVELATVNSGLLYNVLFRNNSQGTTTSFSTTTPGTGSGYMVNCTVAPNSMRPAVGNTANNIIATEYSHFAPYLGSESVTIPYTMPKTYGKNLWYQLVETSSHIDEGSTEMPSALPTNLRNFIHFDQDLDLLGNPRLISTKVDYGCFETWSTKNSILKPSAADYHYPHSGSVVYVDAAHPLVCEKDQFSTAKQNVLKPAYVLVSEGGSLYGQGNELEFDYLAVERGMTGKYALAAVPYRFNITEGITKEGSSLKALDKGELSLYSYDGNARAAWDYNYASSNSGLWKGLISDIVEPNEGFLIKRASTEAGNVKYRFTNAPQIVDGMVMPAYSEDGSKKTITLQQYDDRESESGGSDFTSVYNMGWNLKGMPYLISNYPISQQMEDGSYAMNVPHVIHTMDPNGSYVTKQSWASSDNTLSPGEAFFTQTATLNDTVNLHFAQLQYTSSASTNTANTRSAVTISLAPANATGADASGSVGVPPAAGAVCLQPVDNTSDDNTSMVYTINRDGAKFMSMNPSIPDIAVCGAGGEMMSLSGAAPVEKEISLATRVGSTGRYIFSLDRSAGVSPATTEVWLKDYQTGIVTNLMEDDYTAEITTGENPASPVLTTGRFSLTIGGVRPDIGERDENSARWTISINHCHVSVSGLSTDSDVLFYTTDGILRHRATPFLGKCEAELSPGVYVVRAEGNSKVIGLVRRDK